MLRYCGECRPDNWPMQNLNRELCTFCGCRDWCSIAEANTLPEPKSEVLEIFGNMRQLYAAWYRLNRR